MITCIPLLVAACYHLSSLDLFSGILIFPSTVLYCEGESILKKGRLHGHTSNLLSLAEIPISYTVQITNVDVNFDIPVP